MLLPNENRLQTSGLDNGGGGTQRNDHKRFRQQKYADVEKQVRDAKQTQVSDETWRKLCEMIDIIYSELIETD